MNKKIPTGIIGLGRSGWHLHAAALEAHPQFEVVAVADPESTRRDEAIARFGCAAYETPESMLADAKVELVVVATPSHTHAPLTIAALHAGKHVLVEKPMATSVGEADAMLESAHQAGKMLHVYQLRRKSPDFLKVREIIGSGVLGPIHLIKMSICNYQRRSDWQTLQKFGGGNLNNTGPHFIDQALVLAGGEWHDLFADMRHLISAGDADDHLKIVFRGQSGVVVDVEISSVSAAPVPPHWTILGSFGAITGSPEKLNWRYYDSSAAPERVVNEATPERAYERPENLPWIEMQTDLAPNDTGQLFYSELFATIREGAPSPASGEELRELIALFDACRAQNPQLNLL